MSSRTLPPQALEEWSALLQREFDLQPQDLPISLILDLARDVAYDVARPAAPFSAFAAGLVVGRASSGATSTAEVLERITTLAAQWPQREASNGSA